VQLPSIWDNRVSSMSTWSYIAKHKGYWDSDSIQITLDGDALLSKITWTMTEPADTSIQVFTSLSYNNLDWSNWTRCTNDGSIPDLFDYSTYGTFYLKYRIVMESSAPSGSPVFRSINIALEPVLVFDNKGDVPCTPEIWITKKGNGDFSLINLSNGNEEFKFTDLIDQETIYVNSERQHIETSLPVTYRYSNFNDHYLKVPVGTNTFRVTGNAQLKFRYQYKLMN